MTDEVLTLDEVAERLKLTRRFIEKLIVSGELRAIKIGGATRVLASDLKNFLDSRPSKS